LVYCDLQYQGQASVPFNFRVHPDFTIQNVEDAFRKGNSMDIKRFMFNHAINVNQEHLEFLQPLGALTTVSVDKYNYDIMNALEYSVELRVRYSGRMQFSNYQKELYEHFLQSGEQWQK
jgi:hypothetical protein